MVAVRPLPGEHVKQRGGPHCAARRRRSGLWYLVGSNPRARGPAAPLATGLSWGSRGRHGAAMWGRWRPVGAAALGRWRSAGGRWSRGEGGSHWRTVGARRSHGERSGGVAPHQGAPGRARASRGHAENPRAAWPSPGVESTDTGVSGAVGPRRRWPAATGAAPHATGTTTAGLPRGRWPGRGLTGARPHDERTDATAPTTCPGSPR